MDKKIDIVSVFGARLREARNDKNLKQQELADMSGIALSTLSAYENTKLPQNDKGKAPSIYTAYKMSEALGVSLDWLCGLSEYKNGNAISLHGIADMIEGKNNIWNVLQNVVETEANKKDENAPPICDDKVHHVAIATKSIHISNFVREYQNAWDALNTAKKASKDYELPKEVFENMKASIINKHMKILNETTGGEENE